MMQDINISISRFLQNSKKIPHSKIKEIKITLLTGDASIRKYFRLSLGKKTFILCYDKTFVDEKHDFLVLSSFLHSQDFLVPKVVEYNLQEHIMLLDDLGDTTLLSHLALLEKDSDILSVYKKLIDNLINFQKISINDKRFSFNNRFFDEEKYVFEWGISDNNFLKNYLKYNLGANEEKINKEFWGLVIKKLAEHNTGFTHRDFHSRNIMYFRQNLYIIDFQDARIGCPQYDLVSLLEDCYYPLSCKHKQQLLMYYWKRYEKINKKMRYFRNYKEFQFIYDLMKMQRLYKAIGSFTLIFNRDNNPRYLKYVDSSFLKMIETLRKYPKNAIFSQYKKTLLKAYYGS